MSKKPIQQPVRREEKINRIFEDWLSHDHDKESTEQKLQSLEPEIYQALLVYYKAENAPKERKELIYQKMKEFMREMNTNNPALVDSEKMLRSIGSLDFKKAADYAESLEKKRLLAIKKSQTDKAKLPRVRKKHPLRILLEEVRRENLGLNYAVLTKKLIERGKEDKIISSVDEDKKTIICIGKIKDIQLSTVREWVDVLTPKAKKAIFKTN